MIPAGESPTARIVGIPGVQRVPSPLLELFVLRDFLPAGLCAELVALIEAKRRPSELANSDGDPTFRTSETCDLDPGEPAVEELEQRLREASGIDRALGEPIQGQRYLVGQEFQNHVDWFGRNGPDWEKFCGVAGQRTWTFMVYLNDVEAGGGTRFRSLRKTFHPETGKLLAWNNLHPDGSGNRDTFHQGMKVRAGSKYVITRWYREKPWG
ncbi:2OG-Fe(II) oxygenase [Novosphingobium marinum]|uniref:prolyl hydroxylase family protein n=1 Tax=Novosphingobium marinum TaxID=1514948 RepID=UPI0015C76957|nr:2OG-Fe(II) oxygenase [Novosphingobium marinum]GGC41735.1 2OG-Fe(II) oxygenase [Novosphingobium marinum]